MVYNAHYHAGLEIDDVNAFRNGAVVPPTIGTPTTC